MNSASSSLLVFAILPALVAVVTIYLNRWSVKITITRKG
jgi:hypothetical protein